jgi:hypothetical protein
MVHGMDSIFAAYVQHYPNVNPDECRSIEVLLLKKYVEWWIKRGDYNQEYSDYGRTSKGGVPVDWQNGDFNLKWDEIQIILFAK